MIVKICGITNVTDAHHALDVGADWIGLNFVGGPRKILWDEAQAIITSIDDPTRIVVLATCISGSVETPLLTRLFNAGVRRIQLYGDVNADTIRSLKTLGVESIMVFHVGCDHDLIRVRNFLTSCQSCLPNYILIDAAVAGKMGGTGCQANWQILQEARERSVTATWPTLLLAGGLTPVNVPQAIAKVRPDGVDVSSGVEVRPGIKDVELMRSFVEHVRDIGMS